MRGTSTDLAWVRAPQQSRSQRTLERLLDAAEELVIERGFEGTTVADVTRRAGSSVGAFYSRFHDKHGLLHGLLGRFIDQAEATIDLVSRPETWGDAELDDIVRGLIEFALRSFSERRLLLAAFSRHLAEEGATSFRDVLGERMTAGLVELLSARGLRVGRSDPRLALQVVTWLILSAFEASAVHGSEGPPGMARERTVTELADLALAYLAIECSN